MRKIIALLMIVILLVACNHGEDRTVVKDSTTDVQEKAMQEAIRSFPDSLLLKENLAQFYRDNADYDKAIGVIDNAIQKDSLNARLWNIKAELHAENEDTLNAIRCYETANSLLPDLSYVKALGALYAETKNARALAMADTLIKSFDLTSLKEGLFIKGLYFNYTGAKDKAISFFDQCLAMDYTYMLAYREKAIALYDQQKYDAALAVLNKAVTLQNSFDEGYYWMGRCLEKLNKPKEAIGNYQKALQYDPEYVEAKEALDRLVKN
jgi:tetratricopeptide (TPR) repeat protein